MKITIQEVIAFLMVLALIILTFKYPSEFKERFGQVLSAILGAYFMGINNANKKD